MELLVARVQRRRCAIATAQDEMTHMVRRATRRAALDGSCTECPDVEQASRMSRAAGVWEQDE